MGTSLQDKEKRRKLDVPGLPGSLIQPNKEAGGRRQAQVISPQLKKANKPPDAQPHGPAAAAALQSAAAQSLSKSSAAFSYSFDGMPQSLCKDDEDAFVCV